MGGSGAWGTSRGPQALTGFVDMPSDRMLKKSVLDFFSQGLPEVNSRKSDKLLEFSVSQSAIHPWVDWQVAFSATR